MEKISLLIVGLALVISMISAGPSMSMVFAKKSSDSGSSGSSDNSGSGSGDSGSSSGSSGGSSDNPSHINEAKPSDSGNNNGEINNPQHPGKGDNKDISDIPEENGAHCLSGDCPKPNFRNGENPITPTNPNQPQCMIPEGCHFPNHPPFIHFPIIHLPPVIIKITKVIHEGSSGGSSGGSGHSLSKACFDAIKIAWFGKVHRGQNHEVDKFIDNCLT